MNAAGAHLCSRTNVYGPQPGARGPPLRPGLEGGGQAAHRGAVEQHTGAGGGVDALLQLEHHLLGQDGVAPDVEEVVVQAEVAAPQHLCRGQGQRAPLPWREGNG